MGRGDDPTTDVWVHVCGPRVCRSGQAIGELVVADDPRPTSSSLNPLTVWFGPYLAPSSVKPRVSLAPFVGSSRPNARVLVPSFDNQSISQALSNNVENPTTASCAKTSSPEGTGSFWHLVVCGSSESRALGRGDDPTTDAWVTGRC